MEFTAKIICVLLSISLAVIVVPLIFWAVRRVLTSRKHSTGFNKGLLIMSAMLLGAIFFQKTAEASYVISTYDLVDMNLFEKIAMCATEVMKCLLSTLQTFSMDADHDGALKNGIAMLGSLSASETVITLYKFYSALLNVLAPIAGGVILFEILTTLFPRIRLYSSYLLVWKEKYFFSELNERSLALANSIYKVNEKNKKDKKNNKKPILIFTDTYIKDDDEKLSEMLLEAKSYGAICTRYDISHISKPIFGKIKYFLIDEDETGNIQTFAALSDDRNYKRLLNSEVYLFSQNDVYGEVEKRINEKLISKNRERLNKNIIYRFIDRKAAKYKKDEEDESEKKPLVVVLKKKIDKRYSLPTVIPIQSRRNLVYNLLDAVPLYEPVINKRNNSSGAEDIPLEITILGSGQIGMQMFLGAYWCGQMLGCRLSVNVISMEDESNFRRRLDFINPDILSSQSDGNYFTFKYCKAYLESDRAISDHEKPSGNYDEMLDADYFVIALGSDRDNMVFADKIRSHVGRRHINNPGQKTVISYVIYDSELCDTLNSKFCYSTDKYNKNDIYTYAFGSRDEVYSVKNVFMTRLDADADEIGSTYNSVSMVKRRAKANAKRGKDNYSYWSDIARAVHKKYKMFSAGYFSKSVFDFETKSAYQEYVKSQEAEYRGFILNKKKSDEEKVLLHELAWLEHRRWNAFMRTGGYTGTDNFANYYMMCESHKHNELKLHPCITECGKGGILAEMDDVGRVISASQFGEMFFSSRDKWDALDKVSEAVRLEAFGFNESPSEPGKKMRDTKQKIDAYDFKIYDYPVGDFFENTDRLIINGRRYVPFDSKKDKADTKNAKGVLKYKTYKDEKEELSVIIPEDVRFRGKKGVVTFVIVRHGYSEFNDQRKFTGQADVKLEQEGKSQAESVADYLHKNFEIDAIYSSDLSRAYDTAGPTSKKFNLPITKKEELREMDLGKWEGKSIDDVKKEYPESFEKYFSDCDITSVRGGENHSMLRKRALSVMRKIAEENDGKTVAVFTHGGFIRSLRCAWSGLDVSHIKDIPGTHNASVTVVKYVKGKAEFFMTDYNGHLTNDKKETIAK